MIKDSNQKQEGGDNSTNLQGQTVNIYHGISYSDAKEIALDVFRTNFIQLKQEAADVAKKRAEEITDNFLEKLNGRNPEAIKHFDEPAMQDALFTTQKEYAKSGDKELGDLLVDILVDRAGTQKRNMLQITLDEALKVAPKLTIEQLDSLTVNFLLARTRRLDVRTLDDLKKYIDKHIIPFAENLTEEHSDLNHIEYLGCGHIRAGNYGTLESKWQQVYKAFFQKGFTKEEFEQEMNLPIDKYRELIMDCMHDPKKLQLNAFDNDVLKDQIEKLQLTDGEAVKLKTVFDKWTKSPEEIKGYLLDKNPDLDKIFRVWDNSSIKHLELTSVGIAVAHANYRRRTGETMDLKVWIK